MPELHTNRLIMTTFTVEMMKKVMKNEHTFTEDEFKHIWKVHSIHRHVFL